MTTIPEVDFLLEAIADLREVEQKFLQLKKEKRGDWYDSSLEEVRDSITNLRNKVSSQLICAYLEETTPTTPAEE